jgi:hypothetical protein
MQANGSGFSGGRETCRGHSPMPMASKPPIIPPVCCKPLILIEAPSSAYPRGMLALGTQPQEEEETSCDSTPSRTNFMVASTCTLAPWSLCLVNQDGESVLHRNMKAAPDPLLKAIAPYREALVVAVEWTLDLVLARRPLRPGTDALCPRACVVYESDPRRQGQTRHDRRPEHRRSAAWRDAPAGLRLSRRDAGHPRLAPAPLTSDTSTRRAPRARPADQPPGQPARAREAAGRQGEPGRCGGTVP